MPSATRAAVGGGPATGRPSWHGLVLGAVVAAFVLFAAWRASLGISFVDDAHYAAVTLRLARGARVFADEMTSQGLGFVLAAPFARLWTAMFGTAGIVLALRLFYVAAATAVGYVIYRSLRPSFGLGVSAIAAWTPLLVPPYNIFSVSYNTAAMLGFAAAGALGFAAIRDRSRGKALAAGVALAVGVVSYPPLGVGAVVFAVTLALVARDRRVTLPFLAGAAGVALVAGAWLLLTVSPHDVTRALNYSNEVWNTERSPLERVTDLLTRLRQTLTRNWLWPMWVCAAIACIPQLGPRWRAVAVSLIPLLAYRRVVPDFVARGQHQLWWTIGTAWLMTASLGVLPPAIVWVLRERRGDVARLLILTAPVAVVNWSLVTLMTRSGWHWDIGYSGFAPLAVATLVAWGSIVKEGGSRTLRVLAAAALLSIAVVLLLSISFKDARPLALDHRIRQGPLAGIATTPERAAQAAAIESLGRRWVKPDDRVLVFNKPLAYLLVGGQIATNAVWLTSGPSDRYTVEYFRRKGESPDVAFVGRGLYERMVASGASAADDPLLAFLKQNYRMVDSIPSLVVFVRR